jgi:hypothetical protein
MTEPFIIKHYASDERPTLKGNGFDGLEIGTEQDRDWAEQFVAWINAKLATGECICPKCGLRHGGSPAVDGF